MKAELDLAKLALTEGLEKEIWAELGDLAARVRGSIGDGGGVGIDIDMRWRFVGVGVVGDGGVGGALVTSGRVGGRRRMGGDGDGAGMRMAGGGGGVSVGQQQTHAGQR